MRGFCVLTSLVLSVGCLWGHHPEDSEKAKRVSKPVSIVTDLNVLRKDLAKMEQEYGELQEEVGYRRLVAKGFRKRLAYVRKQKEKNGGAELDSVLSELEELRTGSDEDLVIRVGEMRKMKLKVETMRDLVANHEAMEKRKKIVELEKKTEELSKKAAELRSKKVKEKVENE